MEQPNAVQTALALLHRERDAISRALDVLVAPVKRKYVRRRIVSIITPGNPPRQRRRTKARGWTQAQRTAQARKMRAYWRTRRLGRAKAAR